jgi:hypothetical protein
VRVSERLRETRKESAAVSYLSDL